MNQVKNLDQFGTSVKITFKKDDQHKTYYGVILSLALFGLMVSQIVDKLITYFDTTQVSVDNVNKISIQEQRFQITNKDYNKFVKLDMFHLTASGQELLSFQDMTQMINAYFIRFDKNGKRTNFYLKKCQERFLCSPPEMADMFLSTDASDLKTQETLQFSIVGCNGPACAPIPHFTYLRFHMIDHFIFAEDYVEPIKGKDTIIEFQLSKMIQGSAILEFEKHTLQDNVGFEWKTKNHNDFFSVRDIQQTSVSRQDRPTCDLSQANTPNSCESYVEIKLIPTRHVVQMNRTYLTMMGIFEDVGGFSTTILFFLALLNMFYGEWSYNYNLMESVLGKQEMRDQNFKSGFWSYFYFRLCCFFICSKRKKAASKSALDFYDKTIDILDELREVQNLIINQILVKNLFKGILKSKPSNQDPLDDPVKNPQEDPLVSSKKDLNLERQRAKDKRQKINQEKENQIKQEIIKNYVFKQIDPNQKSGFKRKSTLNQKLESINIDQQLFKDLDDIYFQKDEPIVRESQDQGFIDLGIQKEDDRDQISDQIQKQRQKSIQKINGFQEMTYSDQVDSLEKLKKANQQFQENENQAQSHLSQRALFSGIRPKDTLIDEPVSMKIDKLSDIDIKLNQKNGNVL